jgi:Transposase
MDYFARLDISIDETHVCVLDREGEVVRESKTVSTAQAIADELVKAPSCSRIVFEAGRMAPILFHGLRELGFPVCVESRRAYQALKSLSTHKTDRNDARGLAHYWLLQAGACEVAAGPRRPLAHHRAQEAGGPASNLGKSDPRFGGRVRSPAPAGCSPVRAKAKHSQSRSPLDRDYSRG